MVVVENQATTSPGGGSDGIMAEIDNWRSTRRSSQQQGQEVDHNNDDKMKKDKGIEGNDDEEGGDDDGGLSEDDIVMIATERANSMQVQKDQDVQPIYDNNNNITKSKDGISSKTSIDSKSNNATKSNNIRGGEKKDAVVTTKEKVTVTTTPGFTAVSVAGGGAATTSGGAPTGKESSDQGIQRNVSVGAIQVTPVGVGGGRVGASAGTAGGHNSGDYENLTGTGGSNEFMMVPVVADIVDEEANRRQYTEEIREEILRDAAHAEQIEVIPTKELKDAVPSPSTSHRRLLMAIVGVIVLVVIIAVAAVVSKSQKSKKEDDNSPTPTISDWDYLVDLFSTTSPSGRPEEGSNNENTSNGGGFTDLETLLDESSPQYQALHWLANVDTLYRDSEDPTVSTTKIQSIFKRYLSERYALAVLYYSTNTNIGEGDDDNGDGGSGWIDDMKFLSNTSICEWDGITCNSQDYVLTLEIDGNNMNGTIPEELKALRSLFHLSFYNNQLYGQLPEGLGTLSDLEEIDMQVNLLSGTIPESYSELRSMKNFWFYSNLLTGTIPDGLTKISSMEHFLLWDNMMEGSIPEFAINAAVRDINLLQNQFTGTLPESLYTLVRLENLYLGWNLLEGSISSEIGKLVNLKRVWFNTNLLDGPLPTEIGKLKTLNQGRLQENQLTGPLPTEIGRMEELQDLKVDSNMLSGTIPSEIGNLKHLQTITFNNNDDIVGEVPLELCNIGTIESVAADCGGDDPSITCTCCTTCCDTATGNCTADVQQSCSNIARKYAAPAHRGTTCDCNMSPVTESEGCDADGTACPFIAQTCTDTTCETCNEDGSVCGINVDYGLDFAEDGNWMSFRGEFHYTVGREDIVSYQLASSSFPDVETYVSINGQKCVGNFASWVCANGLRGWVVECDNLGEDGISIDTCQDPEPFGPLQFLFESFAKQGCQTPIAPYCYWYQRNCIE